MNKFLRLLAAALVLAAISFGQTKKYNVYTGKLDFLSAAGSGEANTASNPSATGIGVFHAKSGVDLQMRSLIAGSTKVVLTQADTNRQIVIDVDPTQFSLATIGAGGTSLPVNRLAALTASRAIVTDASGFIMVAAVTSSELGFLAGVSSGIQGQINTLTSSLGAKQAADQDLADVAGLSGFGLAVRRSGSWATVSLAGATNDICLAEASGQAGNPGISSCATVDWTAKTATRPVKAGTTPPGTCADNDMFIDTDASATQALLYCRANTWYAQGTGGTAAWGSVTGTLSAQTDLQSALDSKVSLSGSYITPAWLVGINPSIIGTGTITNSVTFGGGSSLVATASNRTAPVRAGTTPPGTCNDGDLFIDTDASATQALLYCRSNTWYAQGTGGTAAWGSITGTLSAQTDLQSALDAKAATSIPVLTTTAVAGLSAESNLGALSDNNIVAVDVSAGTATPRAAAFADVIALFASGACSGYPKSDGTCDSGGGSGTLPMPTISGGGTSTVTIGANCTTSAPCNYGKGEQTYPQTTALTCQITAGTSTDTVYIYATKTGVLECGSTSRTITCGGVGGCQVPTSITAFPYDSIPLYAVTASGTTYDAITGAMDKRAVLNTGRRLADGTGIVINEVAGTATPSITSIVARRDVANSFTDKQTFTGNGTSGAAINVASQTAPSSPANGDVWHSSNALNAQVNGATVNLGAADVRLLHVKYWGTGSSSVLQDTDDELTVLRNRYAGNIEIISAVCETDTGSPTVQLQKDDGGPTNMLSGSLTCDGTPTTSFVSGENTLATGDRLDTHVVSAGGSAHWVAITVAFKVK